MIEDKIEVNIAGGLDVALPRMVNVRQKFDGAHLGDIPATVTREFQRPEVRARVKAGAVHLYSSGLSSSERALTGVNLIDSMEETLQQCIGRNDDRALAVIPEGPYVVPYYQPA